jgi:hypothetical protein
MLGLVCACPVGCRPSCSPSAQGKSKLDSWVSVEKNGIFAKASEMIQTSVPEDVQQSQRMGQDWIP